MKHALLDSIADIINKQNVGQQDIVENLLNLLFEVNFKDDSGTKTLSELFDDNIDKWQTDGEHNHLIKTGFENLDIAIGGFYPGELVVVGSRPTEGKTQLLINLAINISMNFPSLFYSYDLSHYFISSRFVSTLTGISMQEILKRNLNTEQKAILHAKIKELSQQPLLIHSGNNTSINAFKLMSLKFIKENGVKVIFIDFYQCLSSSKYRRHREQEISHVSRELKKFAKENMVLIIASSQLNRAAEARKDSKVPQLTDLRESGSIEQDADKVIFIHRPEYLGFNDDDKDGNDIRETDLHIAKNRNGVTGKIRLIRDPKFTTFRDFKDEDENFTFSNSRLNEFK